MIPPLTPAELEPPEKKGAVPVKDGPETQFTEDTSMPSKHREDNGLPHDVVKSILAQTGPAVLLPIPKGEKGPKLKRWHKLRLSDMTPEHLAGLNHGHNIGVVLGASSDGLCTVDADTDDGLERFLMTNPVLRESLISRGSRGGNVWLRIIGSFPKNGTLNAGGKPWGEWRATGNQTVIHGIHPSGCEYQRNDRKAVEIPFEEIRWPEELELPWKANPEQKAEPTPEDTAPYTPNDAGRADRFVNRFKEDVRYIPDRNVWMTWDDERWRQDRDGAMERLAMKLSREMLAEAARIEGFDELAASQRRSTSKEALHCGDRRNITNLLSLAKVNTDVHVAAAELDSDNWLVGAKNAVIDLKTGFVREFGRTDFITKSLGCDADPAADCPRWERFMEEVFPDTEVRRYVWKAAGYSLTGNMREQCFFFLHGTGRNGKSKFIEALDHVFGTYSTRAGKGIVAASQRGDYPAHEVADLAGARLVLTSETEEGERLHESIIKDLTGGDTLRGEQKYERAFVFQPVCKLWIIGNHKPSIRGVDDGMWRRVRLIPFTQKFEGTSDDKNLGETLKAEASGILNWLVQGCLLWQAEGLEAPTTVMAATDDYRAEEDTLGAFIEECTEESAGAATPHREIYKSYQWWAGDSGIRNQLSSKGMVKRLKERGWQSGRTAREKVLWQDIKLEGR